MNYVAQIWCRGSHSGAHLWAFVVVRAATMTTTVLRLMLLKGANKIWRFVRRKIGSPIACRTIDPWRPIEGNTNGADNARRFHGTVPALLPSASQDFDVLGCIFFFIGCTYF